MIKKFKLKKFVGPNKNIFRTREDSKTYVIDFIIPISKRNFHDGKIKINIASSNGVQLTEICEILPS